MIAANIACVAIALGLLLLALGVAREALEAMLLGRGVRSVVSALCCWSLTMGAGMLLGAAFL